MTQPATTTQPRRGRAGRAATGVLVLALAGGTVALGGLLPEADRSAVAADEVEVPAGTSTLVCPGPLALPEETSTDSQFERVPVAPEEATTVVDVSGGGVTATVLGQDSITVTGGAGRIGSPTAPVVLSAEAVDGEPARVVGATASQVADGDLRGLSTGSCTRPAADVWLVGGSTTLDAAADLVLVNPGATAADVSIQVWGPNGPVDLASGADLLLAPGASRTVVLPSLAVEERRVAVHVQASGGQVAAYLQDSLLDGFTPRGTDLVSAGAPPATDVLVPGVVLPKTEVDSEDAAALRLVVPGTEDATVSVSLYGADGRTALSGAQDLALTAGQVTDISLGGLPTGAYTVRVTADQPVAAAVMVARAGTPGELDQVSRLERAWAPSVEPGSGLVAVPAGTRGTLTVGVVDAPDELLDQPKATPTVEPTAGQRPTPEAEDTTDLRATLPVTVRLYGTDGLLAEVAVDVPAGSTADLPMADLVALVPHGSVAAEDVRALEVVADPGAQVSWGLQVAISRQSGPLLSVLAPLTDARGAAGVPVRSGSTVGIG